MTSQPHLVDLSSMIDPHLSQIMLKHHVIETQEYNYE